MRFGYWMPVFGGWLRNLLAPGYWAARRGSSLSTTRR
jgi:hypothetical protein